MSNHDTTTTPADEAPRYPVIVERRDVAGTSTTVDRLESGGFNAQVFTPAAAHRTEFATVNIHRVVSVSVSGHAPTGSVTLRVTTKAGITTSVTLYALGDRAEMVASIVAGLDDVEPAPHRLDEVCDVARRQVQR
jgi:hypothetical protein